MLTGTIEQIAEQAGLILASVVEGAFCEAQEWDSRIDCLVQLPDGRIVGEMILLKEVDEERIRESGLRLKQRLMGVEVPLRNEIWAPIAIRRGE